MVQYGLWPNCCNNCDFCLRLNRTFYTKEQQLFWIDRIKQNIKTIDWKNDFPYGISILGGEIYYITDSELQTAFLDLIDTIIEYVLLPSDNPDCKYSSVTNGIYNPDFLFKVCDKIKAACGKDAFDINFSYDLKHRYKNEHDRLLTIENINKFHERYDYQVGVQMIMTKYVIDMIKTKHFDIKKFLHEDVPGSILSFLYPHPIHSGIEVPDFYFSRSELLWMLQYLKSNYYDIYMSFINSTKNSGVFKYTGYRDRIGFEDDIAQKPRLSDGKEILNEKCGHSTLYQCYTDADKCMLCDIKNFEGDFLC